MYPSDKKCLEKVYWQDVREQVALLQPEFAQAVDEISPGKELPLYIARYKYGDLIVDKGKFYLPNECGKLLYINDPDQPSEIREDLGYGHNELAAGMVLDKSIEVFVTPNERIVPYWFYKRGVIFALWTYLDKMPSYHPTEMFSITAGARSTFLLPSIGDAMYHNNLERYFDARLPRAKNLTDQHKLFVELANHPKASPNWETKLLFFSRAWIEKIHSKDTAWLPLQKQLFEGGWHKTAFWRNQLFYSMTFSLLQSNKKLRFNPYLIDTAKHLLAIIMGYAPAFVPALDNSAAPVKFLQHVFLDVYRMKEYVPVIMYPDTFSLDPEKSRPVYYSLQLPTTMEFSPSSTKASIVLKDLLELQQIMQMFISELKMNNISLGGTPIVSAMDKVALDFFHNKKEQPNYISLTKEMPKFDSDLNSCLAEYSEKRKFAASGSFMRGCVRFSCRKKN